ncbi:Ig-like domain-containing protein, partial [Candidatus Latescibacterota bacterium]
YAFDTDGDPLAITWGTPENVQIQLAGTEVTITGKEEFIGSEEIVFTVTDPAGLSDSDTMVVTLSPGKNPPVWSKVPKIGFAQNQADSSLVLWNYVEDPDDPDSLLTFEITNEDDIDLWFVDDNSGRLYLYDLDNNVGWDRLTVTSTDPDGNMSYTQFLAFVAPADGTPIIGGIPDTTIVAGTQINWIDLDDYYYDVDHTDSQMTWVWERLAIADSSVTVSINRTTHGVRLMSLGPGMLGSDKIFFTVTDPDQKFADDICIINVVQDLAKPILDLPPKVGFIAGITKIIDLDKYVYDAEYDNTQLSWSLPETQHAIIALEESDQFHTRPVSFTGTADWIGWESADFSVINPLGRTARDTLTVFSVPEDGTPVAGGLTWVNLRAGECKYVYLDDYFYDADTQEYAVIWTVSGNDSISVTIDPLTHNAHLCALSETWEGQEILTFTVTDPENHSSSMDVPVNVTGAIMRNVLSTDIFRNPMQEDYMDIYVNSKESLKSLPTLYIRIEEDSTYISLEAIGENYYAGRYLLPLDLSLGVKGIADVIMGGTTTTGKAIQDTTHFAYGSIDQMGGKIAIGSMMLEVPSGALKKPVFITVVSDVSDKNRALKDIPGEVVPDDITYLIGPPSFRTEISCNIGFNIGSPKNGAGVFRLTESGLEFIGANRQKGIVLAEISGSGHYCLGFDLIPPRLKLGNPLNGTVTVSAADNGSGIDAGSIAVIFENDGISWYYDSENGEIVLDCSALVHDDVITFEVSLADRTGNTAVKTFSTSVNAVPGQILVEQNSPNPFNPVTRISFVTTSDMKVSIDIYDLLGRKVRVLTSEHYPGGRHTVLFDARDDHGREISSGVYIYRVTTDLRVINRKMLFLR